MTLMMDRLAISGIVGLNPVVYLFIFPIHFSRKSLKISVPVTGKVSVVDPNSILDPQA